MFMMKNDKKKKRPILVVGIGAMALYGAYSAVKCVKETCTESAKMITKVFKNKKKCENSAEDCKCNEGDMG